jgi:hypothetical protein
MWLWKNLESFSIFGYMLEPVVEIWPKKKKKNSKFGELGPFCSQKSFVCVQIIFSGSKMQKFSKNKYIGILIQNSGKREYAPLWWLMQYIYIHVYKLNKHLEIYSQMLSFFLTYFKSFF